MSALRLRLDAYLDPTTRQPYVPEAPRSVEVYPVTRRLATPEELARFGEPEPRVSPVLRRVIVKAPRLGRVGLPRYTDDEVMEAVRVNGSPQRAAEALGVSRVTVYRRLTAMRRAS